jgi:hypothetical protein
MRVCAIGRSGCWLAWVAPAVIAAVVMFGVGAGLVRGAERACVTDGEPTDAAEAERGAGVPAWLTIRHFENSEGPRRMRASQARRDLDLLQAALAGRYSYARLRGVDYVGAIDAVKGALGDGIDPRDFAIHVSKILTLFGDGHTRVMMPETAWPEGCLPFVVDDAGGRVVALTADRAGFVVPGMPYVIAIDGVPIERWRDAATRVVASATEAMRRAHATDVVARVNFLRRELGLIEAGAKPSPMVMVDVGATPSEIGSVLQVELVPRPMTARRNLGETRLIQFDGSDVARGAGAATDGAAKDGAAPGNRPTVIPGRISAESPSEAEDARAAKRLAAIDPREVAEGFGYVRIASMRRDLTAMANLRDALDKFSTACGLIIDVRGNGGGTRDVLLMVAPRLLASDESVRIVNFAAVRLHPDNPGVSSLEDRFLQTADDPSWRPEEREIVRRVTDSFSPEWMPPEGEFTPWSLLALRPGEDEETPFMSMPVVVLMDGGCFSATDVFLSALQGRPRITLLGTPSGGGSGWPQRVRLPDSRLSVFMSSSASFRADGTLFEGRGVVPDVIVETVPSDLIGKTDTQLEAALELLRRAVGE